MEKRIVEKKMLLSSSSSDSNKSLQEDKNFVDKIYKEMFDENYFQKVATKNNKAESYHSKSVNKKKIKKKIKK